MGTENIWLICFNVFMIALASIFYSLGGTAGFSKLFRRLGSSASIGVALNFTALFLHTWHWQYALVPVILFLIYSEGYGGETTSEKFERRATIALCLVGFYLFCLWAHGFSVSALVVFFLSSMFAFSSVVIGVVNPWDNARLEEAVIGFVTSLFLITWPFVR